MKINSSLTLTVVLLIMVLGSGTASAWYGYNIGYDALKGVTQPDVNPSKKLKPNKSDSKSDQEKDLDIIPEKEILAQVDNYIKSQKGKKTSTATVASTKTNKQETQKPENQDSFIKTNETQKPVPTKSLPMSTKDQDITLEVVKVSEQGGALLLDVNLKNDSKNKVSFLYSFLEVKNDADRPLSATTDSLPEDLPANGEMYSGIINIPLSLLQDTKTVSISLTDYPEQQLKLNLTDIPVIK